MSDLTIRRATAFDTAAVATLFDEYRQFYEQPADPIGAGRFITDRLMRDESVIFIAIKGDSPAGFTQLYPSFSSVSMAPIWVLNDLYVTAAHRRCGAGRALLSAAADFARSEKAVRLCLETAPENTQAQGLYESTGWKRGGFFSYSLELC